jgi:IclR family pca regulon transcriptional regulator
MLALGADGEHGRQIRRTHEDVHGVSDGIGAQNQRQQDLPDGASGDDIDLGEAPPVGFVQSFERGLAVIATFDGEHSSLTLSDVARRTGITRAAARRLLLTLVQLGYVRMDGRQFALRPKVLSLGYAYLSTLALPELALPALATVASAVRESAYLSVLDDDEIICVADVPVRRIWNASIAVGTRFPAFATAAGRVILANADPAWIEAFLRRVPLPAVTPQTVTDPALLVAELASVRERGWSLVDHELEEGLRTMAVAVHDDAGRAVAAVSVSTLTARTDEHVAKERMLPALQTAARAIETDMQDLREARVGPAPAWASSPQHGVRWRP